MVSRSRAALLSGLGAAVLMLGLLAPSSTASTASTAPDARAAARSASLTFGPDGPYVGGQGLTLTGQLPKAGVRKIWLERNMNRPSDVWTRLVDLPYRGTTRADGSFTMDIHAPSMYGVSYRVRGAHGGGVTPRVTFTAKTQDVTLAPVDPLDLGLLDPVVGLPFVIAADTTPSLYKRPDTQGLPVFVGRELTLQEQTGPTTWQTRGTTRVLPGGMGYFPPIIESDAGDHVYRVRMEDWTEDGSDIGWQASFPTYVSVRRILGVLGRPSEPAPVVRASRPAGPGPEARGDVVVTGTAAAKYHWNPVRWGFAWEEGEDLDSKPKNGVKRGRWVQYTDGAGRAGKHNGGLRVDSARLEKTGTQDFGTTRATLAGNASSYGRWEARLRAKTFESRQQDYDIALELVPERPADYACGRRTITIARYSGVSGRMTFGVNAMKTRWVETISAPSLSSNIPAFAVEVARNHISWFLNGQVIGVVRSKAAVSDVPMTLQFSLIGDRDTEYDNTSIYSDWQRSFGIDTGEQVTRGPRLAKKSLTGCPDEAQGRRTPPA